MKLIFYISILCRCLYMVRRKRHSYFPMLSLEDQKIMYDRYLSLIISEQERPEFEKFEDSMIDIKEVNTFRSQIKNDMDITVLVIDLGGSSLKISLIKCIYKKDNIKPEFDIIKNKRLDFAVENNIEPLSKYSWNNWVAKKTNEFLNELKNEAPRIQVPETAALSFSFTIKQTSLSSAEFVACKKHWWFSPEGLNSNNIVEDLNKSLNLEKIKIKANCVLNDVIATLMTGFALNLKNPIGMIIGTGTNAGYLIKKNDKVVLVNTEWAAFDIDNIFNIDECSKKFFVDGQTKSEYRKLEVLTAGMKLEEIIKERIKELEVFEESEIDSLDTFKIYDICKKVSNSDVNRENITLFERTICEVFKDFKKRTYKILAPMILAAAQDNDEFSLITNGTILGMEYDNILLRKELSKCNKNILPKPKRLIGIYYHENASLIGAAFTSIIFSRWHHQMPLASN
ncbi:uncharacterized protein VICG_02120 [Vittaforma corneae ATCC 50505]|uniref:Phosphotransferase n=1 Tax=Vittaforma corneae (strain ATCC 50505) TaxID=993615 RepID=L2GIY3_VITCO|nr:uncharacterized protein VICG_02120 [Vittaforma corneae ATCC 50505]ELA40843.1 hypothetical protein VICG_02120 [Vittaforma corneae ATCC 50505]